MSICLHVYLSVCVSICLSVCLCVVRCVEEGELRDAIKQIESWRQQAQHLITSMPLSLSVSLFHYLSLSLYFTPQLTIVSIQFSTGLESPHTRTTSFLLNDLLTHVPPMCVPLPELARLLALREGNECVQEMVAVFLSRTGEHRVKRAK